MRKYYLMGVFFILVCCMKVYAQDMIVVRPKEIDDVLVNPGIGFNTFQRFNGDSLNVVQKWTGGFAIEFQEFDGNLENKNYPMTTLAYFRLYWRFLEPEKDKYRWDLIDMALRTASERGQTLILRIAPYGTGEERDIPGWLRAMVGESKNLAHRSWRIDPEDTRYVEHFTDMVRALGSRYDGHPDLEIVDLSIVGFWGEGAGSNLLSDKTRKALVDSYTDSFKKTHLVMLLTDEKTNKYGLSRKNVGWRVDCLGDLGFWAADQNGWNHMNDLYPQSIIRSGMRDAWKKAPVTLESCYTLNRWKQDGYDVDYIIDQSLKWHISSFNNKSSPVPEEWWPQVNRWLNKMGYRFVLRRFSCPAEVKPHEKLVFTSWWENKGVAPCYRKFPLALRLRSNNRTEVFVLDTDIREWLPGDILFDDAVFLPLDMPEGDYEFELAKLDPGTLKPKLKLAIEGKDSDGWYKIGKIKVRN